MLSAASAIALAGTPPSPGTAASARPQAPEHTAILIRPARAQPQPLRPVAASQAIRVLRVSRHIARYTLTAAPARQRHGHRQQQAHPQLQLAPRQVALSMLSAYHWPQWQFRFLDLLWERESNWNPYASNPDTGAYGIPQAFPGAKMASAGPDWQWNARTQIRWGLSYIREQYGSPLAAWSHESRCGWY